MRTRVNSTTAAVALISLAAFLPIDIVPQLTGIGRDDQKWLDSLSPEAARIWRRRMRRGLTESERRFVEDRKAGRR